MAYIYEINGQRVEFEKEPTQEDIDEAARQLGSAPTPVAPSGFTEEAKGVATALAVPAAQALQTVIENPIQSGLGAYGTYKTAQLANAGIDALRNINAPAAPAPTGPVAPSAPVPAPAPATSPILDAQGRPMARAPVAPSAPAPTPKAPVQTSVMDKASQVIRQIAANRVIPSPGMGAKGGLGVMLSVIPGNVGQNYPFPQSGPLKGSEINPGTGRPWTKQELDAYRAQYGG